jgi:hypothetical protein
MSSSGMAGMLHPYLCLRVGKEKVNYPKSELEQVLGKNARSPFVPGAGDTRCHGMRGFHAKRGRPAGSTMEGE